jgi:TolB protein
VSGKEHRVTSGSGLALPGSWSRDGRYLVLSQTQDGNSDLFLYDTQREALSRLTTYWGIDVSPSFAPDGKRFVFTSDRGGSPQLYVTDIQSSEPVRLTYKGSYNTAPVWSPRDDTIAFVGRSATDALDIYTIRANGRGLQRLTDGNGQHEAPSWAPDGRFLMYISQHGDVWQRHLMRRDGQGKRSFPAQGPTCLAPQWIARLTR